MAEYHQDGASSSIARGRLPAGPAAVTFAAKPVTVRAAGSPTHRQEGTAMRTPASYPHVRAFAAAGAP
jgi:hypothetical protein